jgi:pteridine reductase
MSISQIPDANRPIVVEKKTKVALVTGSARRIGAALALMLHEEGYNLILHCHSSKAQADQLAAQVNQNRHDSAVVVTADLGKDQEVLDLAKAALQQWGSIDILINNASAFYPKQLSEVTERDWQLLQSTNAKAPFMLCQALEQSLTSNKGCILNMVDSTAMSGLSGFSPYTMAKAALLNMTRSLAKELAPSVRVVGISPGIILWPDTPQYHDLPLEVRENERQLTALKRAGCVEDIVEAARFLLFQGNYITGQVLKVDGGASLYSH